MHVKLRALQILLKLVTITGWRPFTVTIKNLTYEMFQPEIVDLYVAEKNGLFSGSAKIKKDISQLFIHFELTRDSGQDTYDLVYMNRTVDVCKFLKNRKTNVFFDIAYRILSDYVKLPEQCPLRRKLYSALNVVVDPEKFPPIMPDQKTFASLLAWIHDNGKKINIARATIFINFERVYKNNAGG